MHLLAFNKEEKLCSKTKLDRLFADGSSLFAYPFKILYKAQPSSDQKNEVVQVVFTVPKRTIKHAVDRNLIRRRAKEAYRLNKNTLKEQVANQQMQLHLAFIYIDKEVKDYKSIEKGIKKALAKVLSTLVNSA